MIIYLKALSSLPELSSDKLMASIISALSELYPDEIEDIIKLFMGNNQVPFIVSSAFPFISIGNEYIRFFPNLLQKPKIQELTTEVFDKNKKIKKISFIEESIFLELIKGKLSFYDIINSLEKNYYIKNSSFLVSNKYSKKFDKEYEQGKTVEPRNKISRLNNSSKNIFYSLGNYYGENNGLFFLIKFNDEKFKNYVLSALRFLKDRGFGPDISVGKGHFDFTYEDFSIFDFEGNYFTTLSRFIPNENDLKNINKLKSNSFYEIGFKQGRNSDSSIRKNIKFFLEGSTFPYYDGISGSIIQSQEKSLDFGLAFPIPVNFGD